jgi:hypothetical protein
MKEKLKKSFNLLLMNIYLPNFLKYPKLRFVHHRLIMQMEKYSVKSYSKYKCNIATVLLHAEAVPTTLL